MGHSQNVAQVSEENKGIMDKIKMGQSYSVPFRVPCAAISLSSHFPLLP